MGDAQHVDDRREIGGCAAVATHEPVPIEEIAPHAEMREQAAFLEDVADASLVRRHEHASLGVDQHLSVDRDSAAVGPDQTADDIDDRGLSRTGAAEQCR